MTKLANVTESLISNLEQVDDQKSLKNFHVVLLHDFSIDRFIYVKNYDDFDRNCREILSRGGGILPNIEQSVQSGGCAANTALILASLGVGTHLITRTNNLGQFYLNFFLGRAGVNLSGIKLGGSLNLVTSIEVGPEKKNIMLNSPSEEFDFNFTDLDTEDLDLIMKASLVAVMNWCINPSGTELAKKTIDFLAESNVLSYLDTADPAPRSNEIPLLYEQVLANKGLGHLNLNENELKHIYISLWKILQHKESLI